MKVDTFKGQIMHFSQGVGLKDNVKRDCRVGNDMTRSLTVS
jgi:hypothetical protein